MSVVPDSGTNLLTLNMPNKTNRLIRVLRIEKMIAVNNLRIWRVEVKLFPYLSSINAECSD